MGFKIINPLKIIELKNIKKINIDTKKFSIKDLIKMQKIINGPRDQFLANCKKKDKSIENEYQLSEKDKEKYLEEYGLDEHMTAEVSKRIPGNYLLANGNLKVDKALPSFTIELIALEAALKQWTEIFEESRRIYGSGPNTGAVGPSDGDTEGTGTQPKRERGGRRKHRAGRQHRREHSRSQGGDPEAGWKQQ